MIFTLLLIEDDNLVASYLNGLVSEQTINLIETMDIWLGSQLARKLKPDAIVIHLEFQTLEVYKLMRLLKKHASSTEIPVFFISSEADSQSHETAIKLGVDRAFVTPLEQSQLLSTLQQQLTSSGLSTSTYCPA